MHVALLRMLFSHSRSGALSPFHAGDREDAVAHFFVYRKSVLTGGLARGEQNVAQGEQLLTRSQSLTAKERSILE